MKYLSNLLPYLPSTVLLIGCGNPSKQEAKSDQPQKPNVIYLIADDLGIGDLSCYGATKISTPNIDRLAGQGMQFTNAYATSSTSTPSRFGLLTGMYPWRQENTGIAPGNSELIIDTACVTMADMLKEAGYATGVVGKWHLGLGPKGGTDFNGHITPNAQSIGFDYEFVIPATVDRVPCVFVENGHVVGLDPNDPITVNYEHKVGDWPTGEENPELVKLKPSQGHNNTIINGIPRIGWMTEVSPLSGKTRTSPTSSPIKQKTSSPPIRKNLSSYIWARRTYTYRASHIPASPGKAVWEPAET